MGNLVLPKIRCLLTGLYILFYMMLNCSICKNLVCGSSQVRSCGLYRDPDVWKLPGAVGRETGSMCWDVRTLPDCWAKSSVANVGTASPRCKPQPFTSSMVMTADASRKTCCAVPTADKDLHEVLKLVKVLAYLLSHQRAAFHGCVLEMMCPRPKEGACEKGRYEDCIPRMCGCICIHVCVCVGMCVMCALRMSVGQPMF